MKKLLLAVPFVLLAGSVMAEDLIFNGTVNSGCTFSGTTSGALNTFGTSMTTITPATTVVSNNSAGTFTLTVNPITALDSSPDSQDLASNAVLSPSTVGGANPASAFVGDDTAGYTTTLANAGDDTLSLSVAATLDSTATAGTYSMSSAATCIAL